MTYRAILVHVPLGSAQSQVELAARLAKEFKAHLTGICSLTEPAMLRFTLQNPFIHPEGPKIEDLIKQESEQAAAAEKRFNSIAEEAGISHSWLTGEGEAADLIIHACRLQDLAVVEQSEDPSDLSDLLRGPAVQLALSGHPALIVPRSWRSSEFGNRALVAWNGSAQSASAVRKSLALLRRTDHVTVLLGHSRAAFPPALRVTPLDLLAYLRHEGITAEAADIGVPDADAGKALLKGAQDDKADLIVMGAFGHSRFREWILGGATRQVLEEMTVPVFMAHQ
jgi:nucleotide-binding universal stress UspA family protein